MPFQDALPTRQEQLNMLRDTPEFDVLVVGGGATGAGCALDAITRSEFIPPSLHLSLSLSFSISLCLFLYLSLSFSLFLFPQLALPFMFSTSSTQVRFTLLFCKLQIFDCCFSSCYTSSLFELISLKTQALTPDKAVIMRVRIALQSWAQMYWLVPQNPQLFSQVAQPLPLS